MRIALEEIALKRAIPNMQTLNRITAENTLKLIDASSDPLDWARLNWEFHAGLYSAARMPKLLETASMLHNNVARYLLLYLKDLDFQETSQAEHWNLLQASSAGKTQQAIGILRQHLKDALDQTLQFMSTRS
jgi:DNA-binding GntR family transcriptional regulator